MADNDTPEIVEKVSDIDAAYLADYLRMDNADTSQTKQLNTMLNAAKGFVSSYTGLPRTAPEDADPVPDTLDTYPEFVHAVVVLVQNMYDNRTVYTQNSQVEAVLDSILGMHRRNLL